MIKMLVATDGSEHSLKTLSEACNIALALNADVTVITVIEELHYTEYVFHLQTAEKMKVEYWERAQKILDQAEKIFQDKGIKVKKIIAKGHPAEMICQTAAKENANLVIVGSRGLGGIKELLLGSVSNRVAHCVKSHVMIVK
ncbi:MAG: universal stress protein [Bacillota bacterium]